MFVFPAGRLAGFNPAHPASAGISPKFGLSAVVLGGSFSNLLNGSVGIVAGTPAIKAHAIMGPTMNFTGLTDAVTFSGNNTTSFTNSTMAAIVQFDSVTLAFQSILELSTSGTIGLLCLRDTTVVNIFTTANVSTTFTPVVNTPYFIAMSIFSTTGANFVVRNLATGSLFSQFVSTATSIAGSASGIYKIGNNANQPTLGSISAVMINRSYLGMAELIKWSSRPWDFWYPAAAG